jgi:hypothetical protein
VVVVRGGEDNGEKLRRHAERINRLRTAGFPLLPTFARPHFTIVLPSLESADLDRLLACFDPASHNPGYGRFQR